MGKLLKKQKKAEKRVRKAVKKYAKVDPYFIESRLHTVVNGRRYVINIINKGEVSNCE